MQNFHQEMGNQEDANEFGAINGIATLNLRNTLTDTTSADHRPPLSHHCSACGCFIKKRSHSSSLLSPSPKKKLLFSPSAASNDGNVCEFAKSPIAGNSLHRWNSDSIISSEFGPKAGEILTTSSPARAFSSLPPLPRPLVRSVSDPPPLGLLDTSQFPISGEIGPSSIVRVENPSYNKMKKMKEQLKEMIQYWEDIDDEDDDEEEENGGSIEMRNCEKEDEKVIERHEGEEEETETISVERHGNSLIIQLNCSCGKGSQILLSGKNCYHKLL
ncbi:uncharacterized protein LOC124932894 [Impatiens glandulifera]|uniref:uncharacterized protein LOC124932894 n=1 Tax=Impatiens glandulifera TaxID=253017 RepID=UPI001FB0F1D6|nr:uncharacterized protein LOC124932894 [Impatiens glandulifera]